MEINNIFLKSVLVSISIGIWIVVHQNAGIIQTQQKVTVKNPIKIQGKIDANVVGNVSIDNTVSVSIDEILAEDNKKYYYNNNR